MKRIGIIFLIIFFSSCSSTKDISLEDYAKGSFATTIGRPELASVIENTKLQNKSFSLKHSVTLSYLGTERRFEQIFIFKKEQNAFRISWFAPNYISTLYTAVSDPVESSALDQVNKIFFTASEGNRILLPEFFKTKIYFDIFKYVFFGLTKENLEVFSNANSSFYTDSKGTLVIANENNGSISKLLINEKTFEVTKASISDGTNSVLFEVILRESNNLPKQIRLSSSESDLEFIFNKTSDLEYLTSKQGAESLKLNSPDAFRQIILD